MKSKDFKHNNDINLKAGNFFMKNILLFNNQSNDVQENESDEGFIFLCGFLQEHELIVNKLWSWRIQGVFKKYLGDATLPQCQFKIVQAVINGNLMTT